jgi:hypothetical protein
LSATFNCNVRKVKQCIKVNVHECDTQLKVPYYTIFTSDPEEPNVIALLFVFSFGLLIFILMK